MGILALKVEGFIMNDGVYPMNNQCGHINLFKSSKIEACDVDKLGTIVMMMRCFISLYV